MRHQRSRQAARKQTGTPAERVNKATAHARTARCGLRRLKGARARPARRWRRVAALHGVHSLRRGSRLAHARGHAARADCAQGSSVTQGRGRAASEAPAACVDAARRSVLEHRQQAGTRARPRRERRLRTVLLCGSRARAGGLRGSECVCGRGTATVLANRQQAGARARPRCARRLRALLFCTLRTRMGGLRGGGGVFGRGTAQWAGALAAAQRTRPAARRAQTARAARL